MALSGVSDACGSVASSSNAAGCPAAHLLTLVATPTFGLMAIWSTVGGGPVDSLCGSDGHAWSLSGMTAMYALMAVFHSAPWLAKLSKRRVGDRS